MSIDPQTMEEARPTAKNCTSAEERFLSIIEILRDTTPAERRRVVRAVAVFCDVEVRE